MQGDGVKVGQKVSRRVRGFVFFFFSFFFFPWRGDFLEHQGFNPRAKSESDLIRVSVTGHSQL